MFPRPCFAGQSLLGLAGRMPRGMPPASCMQGRDCVAIQLQPERAEHSGDILIEPFGHLVDFEVFIRPHIGMWIAAMISPFAITVLR